MIHLPDTLSVNEHINERSSVCHSRMRFIPTLAALMTLQSSTDRQAYHIVSYKIIISTTYIIVDAMEAFCFWYILSVCLLIFGLTVKETHTRVRIQYVRIVC